MIRIKIYEYESAGLEWHQQFQLTGHLMIIKTENADREDRSSGKKDQLLDDKSLMLQTGDSRSTKIEGNLYRSYFLVSLLKKVVLYTKM